MRRHRITAAFVGLILALACVVLYAQSNRNVKEKTKQGVSAYAEGNTLYDFAMGTAISVTLYGGGEDTRKEAAAVCVEGIKEADEKLLSWRVEGSELSRLNQDCKAGEPYEVSAELYSALALSLSVCEKSEGALDITLHPLIELWGIEDATKDSFRVPSQEEIEQAKAAVGYEAVEAKDGSITIKKQGMTIDLGACGKGYALDLVYSELKASGISGGVVACGGSVLVFGRKTDGTEIRVGIRDPKGGMDEIIGELAFTEKDLQDSPKYISTSGDYEKYIEADGTRYHHILDRSTGYPAKSGLASVTVVSASGILSDALSTACYVLGYEKSLSLLKEFDSEAIFIDHNNTITISDGLKEFFKAP